MNARMPVFAARTLELEFFPYSAAELSKRQAADIIGVQNEERTVFQYVFSAASC